MAICFLMKLFDSGELLACMLRLQSFELKVVKDEGGGHVAELECLGRKTIIDDQSYTN